AGAEVTDMEFMQFHPTSLVQFEELKDVIALPQFLISEAVRGEGGILLNKNGERFMKKYHTQMELAPRDVVARAIYTEMKTTNSDCVYLSLREMDPEKVKKRFPIIYQTCLERGLDITKDDIPVAPAAHYFMGGIKTDVWGRTNIARLYAAGECASLGIHGANRLASNSLLDGLVFGHRTALKAKEEEDLGVRFEAITVPPHPISTIKEIELNRAKLLIKTTMWEKVGIIRSEDGLQKALSIFQELGKKLDFRPTTKEEIELKNLLLVAQLIARAAKDRKESRGAHFRLDYPQRDDLHWKKHLVYRLGINS
ncbi:MAG: L-aspartate oxidase, partial [Candidatus Margulisiibacteriota bacterium]